MITDVYLFSFFFFFPRYLIVVALAGLKNFSFPPFDLIKSYFFPFFFFRNFFFFFSINCLLYNVTFTITYIIRILSLIFFFFLHDTIIKIFFRSFVLRARYNRFSSPIVHLYIYIYIFITYSVILLYNNI